MNIYHLPIETEYALEQFLRAEANWKWRERKTCLALHDGRAYVHKPRLFKYLETYGFSRTWIKRVARFLKGRALRGRMWQELPILVQGMEKLTHDPLEPLPPWEDWGWIHGQTMGYVVKCPPWAPPRIKKMTHPIWPAVIERPSDKQSPENVRQILLRAGVLHG